MKEPESDFKFEITDLQTGATMSHPLADNASASMDEHGNGETPPPSPPNARRRIRGVVVASVVLLTVALVALVDPTLRSSLSTALLPPPAPSATLATDANLVFLESGASTCSMLRKALTSPPLGRSRW